MSGGVGISVAGGTSFGVAYTLDGAMHNNPYDNLNLPLPFPDAMQEFRVETSSTNANNGMHSGASVNAVTKSGTNLMHGDHVRVLQEPSLQRQEPVQCRDRSCYRRAAWRRPQPQSVRRHVRRPDSRPTGSSSSAPTRAPSSATPRRTTKRSCRRRAMLQGDFSTLQLGTLRHATRGDARRRS